MATETGSGWRSAKLRDLGEVNRGKSTHRPRWAEHLYGGPYPFIQTGDVKASEGRITSYTQTYSDEGLRQSRLWPAGTMCITIAANIAETGILCFEACFPDSIVGFIADDSKCSVYFVEYVFRHLRRRIQREASGSVQDNINLGTLDRLQLSIPPLFEQRRIAAILGALDDKIDLNRRMNQTLETMAHATFKSRFIDFDGALDLVESEIGPIPEGWEVVPLADTGRWVSGGTPSKKVAAFWNGDLPWFSAKSLGPLWLTDTDDRLTKAGAQAGSRCVPRRSVLFIVRGMSLASEWRIGITTREATLNQDLKAIVDNGRVVPELLLLWLLVNRETIRAKADEAGHGTKRLPTEVLHAHAMALPPRAVQEQMAAPLIHLLGRIEINLQESATLAELRDTLLPKLISGELRIPDAEAAIADAVMTPRRPHANAEGVPSA